MNFERKSLQNCGVGSIIEELRVARECAKEERSGRKMPLLQYKCVKCGKRFDELVRSYLDEVKCPDCGGETARDYSGEVFSATGKASKKCSGNCKTCSGCR